MRRWDVGPIRRRAPHEPRDDSLRATPRRLPIEGEQEAEESVVTAGRTNGDGRDGRATRDDRGRRWNGPRLAENQLRGLVESTRATRRSAKTCGSRNQGYTAKKKTISAGNTRTKTYLEHTQSTAQGEAGRNLERKDKQPDLPTRPAREGVQTSRTDSESGHFERAHGRIHRCTRDGNS